MDRHITASLVLAVVHMVLWIGNNYVHQVPLHLGSIIIQWDFITLSLIFLSTIYTTWLYGYNTVRKTIQYCAVPAFLLTYGMNQIFDTGMCIGLDKLFEWDPIRFQIAVASAFAYFVGQATTSKSFSFALTTRNRLYALLTLIKKSCYYQVTAVFISHKLLKRYVRPFLEKKLTRNALITVHLKQLINCYPYDN